MVAVKYVQHDGFECDVDIPAGNTVMQGAVSNMIEGIVAECGGAGACATCHCYVGEEWLEKVADANEIEKETLEMVGCVRSGSRLSCQIKVTEDMDGLIIYIPESQY
ncbi:2Fe-2S iron-sulfur cluster-binding protein [Dasania sp. GY-MA-18]|uniref:2Fe-2S iron-sulfur cluster-binding protein n=1 Tax=Dasania phycosphaerae TaxID=2950436 RepID=A0A9J6RMN2_9GAMM|nr:MULTISPECIES: 2Fe-2S iron-sulfur cluster-binding protein [Dasania]MCR8923145.1 2Fe-2S iron-sulfur cluster-binding protein [Dasania sp. GY-MA-18]MCZ0865577.1 2Fe-2S iron-sulfur cluster-binding protein [Dasania phycosphaerae]MCZ0869302.1 2Fe-2S iron-sulfur cluster-binding protein [Dasania phycosphaerae]